MTNFRPRALAAMFALPMFVPTFAQTPTSCTTAPTAPSVFLIERTFDFANALSTRPVNLSPDTQAALQAGAIEARQQFSLNPTTNVITITEFTVAQGAPSPTPPSGLGGILSLSSFSVIQTQATCRPSPSVLYTGVITQNYPKDPFGDLTAAPAAISIGFTLDTPFKINNVVFVAAGIQSTWSSAGMGTLTFPVPIVSLPITTPQNPVVVFSPAATQATSSKQFGLDASKSTSPLGLQLSFSWRQVNSNVGAALSNANTATPIVTFSGRGDYIFEVTVTDSKGNSTTAQTTISYYGIGS